MVINGFVIYHYQQWGERTWTFDVICGRSPALASAALSTAVVVGGGGYNAVGVTRYKTRNTPVSQEQTVNVGQYYWQWAPLVYNQTMTEVTFAIGTGPEERLTGAFQVTFFNF
jgi:hypothetical protein